MAACRISYNEEGIAIVVDESGKPSELYGKVLGVTNDQDTAINVWSAAVHPDSGLKGENTSVEELLSFMDSHAATGTKLNPEEVSMTTETLRRNGFSTLSEFNSELVRLFKPNGYIEMPEIDFTGKNLFTQDDLRALDLVEVNRLMQKIEGHLTKVGEVYAEPYNQKDLYIDSSKKNLYGMSEKLSMAEINDLLTRGISDFSNEVEIERAVKSSPFAEIVELFNTNEKFRQEVIDDFKDLKRVPTLTMVAGELSAGNNSHYITVKNTIRSGMPTARVDAEMEYLASISNDTWRENPEAAKRVIKEIEKELADMNIDIIGLSNHSAEKEVVIDLLNEASLMAKNPTHKNIAAFTNKLQQLIPQRASSVVELLDNKFEGYNIVHMEANVSEGDLFNQFGLIKVGEDLYHKVDQNANINDVLDFLSKQYVEGEFELPKEFVTTRDMQDKEGVLEDLHTFISSKSEIRGLENKMLYSVYKTIFGHTTVTDNVAEVSSLAAIKTDEQYLKTDFVSDFYNYILQEKVKDSPLYRNTLSHIAISDKDITLVGKPVSIKGLKFEQELTDYIRLKRGNKMRYLIEDVPADPMFEDMMAINFPETVKEISGEYMMHGEHVVTPNTVENYLKVDGELYRKSATNDHSDIFTLISTKKNPIYYTNSTNFTFDKEEAIKELDAHQSLSTPVEYKPEATRVEESMFTEKDNIEDYSTILDSSIKLVDLYNEKERASIVDKLDECGG